MLRSKRYWDPYVHTRAGSKTYTGRFGADVFADFIIEFLKKNRDRPMMVYFPMALTHGPLVPTPHEPDVTKPLDMPVVLARVENQLTVKRARDQIQALNTKLEQAQERIAMLMDSASQAMRDIPAW